MVSGRARMVRFTWEIGKAIRSKATEHIMMEITSSIMREDGSKI
jgi:hypothetical protein